MLNDKYSIKKLDAPKRDNKEYFLMESTTGFKILNIIDKDTDISAANMFVKVGSLHEEIYLKNLDSDVGKGLVHFLEHMLFIETEKYNIDKYGLDYFQDFIGRYNGISNASTHNEFTQYYFTIHKSGLIKAIDIFLHFFIKPTFNPKYVEKEKNAVNNEYLKNIESDIWKMCDMLNIFSKKNHPYRNFTTGNYDTLTCIDNTNFILDSLHLIFNEFYIQSNMILVIYHNENIFINNPDILDTIGQIKVHPKYITNERKIEFLSKYNNIQTKINKFPIQKQDNIRLVEMYSKMGSSKINIIFQVPKYNDSIVKLKPLEYLQYIINSYDQGSIYNILVANNLATNIVTDIIDEFGTCFILLINITLSEEGFIKRNIVANLVLNLITNSQYVNKTIYDNIVNIANLKYEADIENLPLENVNDAINNLYLYSPKYLNSHKIITDPYSETYEKNVKKYLENINIGNCIVFYLSHNFDKNSMIESKLWHKPIYKIHNNYRFTDDISIYLNKYKLPKKNICIPKYLNIYKPILHNKYPEKKELNGIDLWIKTDDKYNTSKCCIGTIITSCNINKNVINYVKINLFILLFDEIVKKYLNCIIKTSFKIETSVNNDDIVILINGYNIYIHRVFEIILFLLIKKNIKEYTEFFVSSLEYYKTCLINSEYGQPYEILYDKHKNISTNNHYSNQEQLYVLENESISTNNIYNIIIDILNSSEIKVLVQGNINENGIDYIAKTLMEFGDNIKPKYKNPMVNHQQAKLINECSDKQHIYYPKNDLEPNYACGIFYQIYYLDKTDEYYLKNKLIVELSNLILSNNFFKLLRTEKQLGYYVRNSIKKIGNIKCPMLHYGFVVQSGTHNIEHIKNEISTFIIHFYPKYKEEINNLDNYKDIMKDLLNSRYNNYEEEFEYNIGKIQNRTYNFNEKNDMITALDDINGKDLVKFYEDFLLNNSSYFVVGVNRGKNI